MAITTEEKNYLYAMSYDLAWYLKKVNPIQLLCIKKVHDLDDNYPFLISVENEWELRNNHELEEKTYVFSCVNSHLYHPLNAWYEISDDDFIKKGIDKKYAEIIMHVIDHFGNFVNHDDVIEYMRCKEFKI